MNLPKYLLPLLLALCAGEAAEPGYRVQLETLSTGFDGKTCWVHARAGAIPGPTPSVVLTMQKLLLTGSDIFGQAKSSAGCWSCAAALMGRN